MTYGILSLFSGHLLVSYPTEDGAMSVAHCVLRAEPEALRDLALVEYNDRGKLLETTSGTDLHNRVQDFAQSQLEST